MQRNILDRRFWLILAGIGCTAGALLHVVVVISGRADWYYSVIGLLRGFLIVPLLFYRPERMPPLRTFDWVAAFIWGLRVRSTGALNVPRESRYYLTNPRSMGDA